MAEEKWKWFQESSIRYFDINEDSVGTYSLHGSETAPHHLNRAFKLKALQQRSGPLQSPPNHTHSTTVKKPVPER